MIESVDLIIRQTGHPERVVRLQEGVTRLGRAEDNDVVLSDVGVSRRHSRIVVGRDSVRIEDLGSGNGTYYRGFRVQSQQVEDGDELVLDPFVLQVRIRGTTKKEPEATDGGSSARLDVVAGGGLARSSYPLTPRGLTIGRSETRDIVVPDPAASRHHCSVLPRDGAWSLRDMGSANGVFVNGIRVRESLLVDGDRIRIGNTEFRLSVGSSDTSQLDSTTSRSTRESYDALGANTEPELRLNGRTVDTPTPNARGPRASGGAGRFIAGGLGVIAVFAFLLIALVFVGLVGVVAYQQVNAASPVAVRVAGPPRWKLTKPGNLAAADVRTLQTAGMDALRKGDNKGALLDFYRILEVDPGRPSAERLAFAAGEYLVLETLQDELKATGEARLAREKKRDDLLKIAKGTGPTRKAALDELVAGFRDDPIVVKALDWTTSDEAAKIDKQLADAAVKQDGDEFAAAADLYQAVYTASLDASQRKTARAGWKASRRELARETALEWRAGVVAEADGDLAAAKDHYAAVKKVDPTNTSVRLRLDGLAH